MSSEDPQQDKPQRLWGTVLIVGSGAVENAWTPVLEALSMTDPRFAQWRSRNKCAPEAEQRAVANQSFSHLIAKLRFLLQRVTRLQAEGDLVGKDAREAAVLELMPKIHELLQDYQRLKHCICDALKAAGTKLRLRRPAKAIRQKLCGPDRTLIVTTNWDNAVEEFRTWGEQDDELVYLHGNVDSPKLLFLPGEISTDPIWSFASPFRSESEQHENGARKFRCCLNIAHKVVFYGLGLNLLDSELGANLWECGLRRADSGRQTWVVDPDHERIVDGLKIFGWGSRDPRAAGESPVEPITGMHPDKL